VAKETDTGWKLTGTGWKVTGTADKVKGALLEHSSCIYITKRTRKFFIILLNFYLIVIALKLNY